MEARGIELVTRLKNLYDLLDDYEGVNDMFRITFYTKEESERMIPLIQREIMFALYDLRKFNQQLAICKVDTKIHFDEQHTENLPLEKHAMA